jgi:cold shock CspA family protein
MARSQVSYNKRELEKKKIEKRQAKQQKAEERKSSGGSGLDDMIAYVDAYGRITDTQPDPTEKEAIDLETIAVSVPKREEEEIDPVHTGKVDMFNNSRGFGFIRETGSSDRYFVHANGLLESIMEGDRVTFEVEKGLKGLMAVKVQKVK